MGKFPNQIIWLVISQKICRETLHFFYSVGFHKHLSEKV